jgi:hypothetical protein
MVDLHSICPAAAGVTLPGASASVVVVQTDQDEPCRRQFQIGARTGYFCFRN